LQAYHTDVLLELYTTTECHKLTAVIVVATSSPLYNVIFFPTDYSNKRNYCDWKTCV